MGSGCSWRLENAGNGLRCIRCDSRHRRARDGVATTPRKKDEGNRIEVDSGRAERPGL